MSLTMPKLENLQNVGQELLEQLRFNDIKEGTCKQYMIVLRDMEKLGIDPRNMTTLETKKLKNYWAKNLKQTTMNVRTAILKKMMKIIEYGDNAGNVVEYPDSVKMLKTKNELSKSKTILTKEEVRKMVGLADNQRDRALLITLYESGCRVSEFLSMNIGDVEFDKYGAVIYIRERPGLNLKTGERRVRVFESAADLQFWMNHHPLKGDRNAPLWPLLRRKNGVDYSRLKPAALATLIYKYGVRLGRINDKGYSEVSPHTFRHSRATHLGKFLTEAQMCEFFGWVLGSDMPRVYIHLSGRDVDDGLFKAQGIKVEEEEEDQKVLDHVECPRCKTKNPGDFQFCGKCGMILDEDVAIKAEMTEKEHTVELMTDVAHRPNMDDKMKRVEKILDMVEKYPKLAEMLEKEVSETEV